MKGSKDMQIILYFNIILEWLMVKVLNIDPLVAKQMSENQSLRKNLPQNLTSDIRPLISVLCSPSILKKLQNIPICYSKDKNVLKITLILEVWAR